METALARAGSKLEGKDRTSLGKSGVALSQLEMDRSGSLGPRPFSVQPFSVLSLLIVVARRAANSRHQQPQVIEKTRV